MWLAGLGSHLYSDSLIALNISGAKPKLVWYRQFVAHDTHDEDPVMPSLLFTGKVHGQSMNLVTDDGLQLWKPVQTAISRIQHL